MKTKPLILFGFATVAALATTASGQNASPSGTVAPKRNQKPASAHISPKSTAIPSQAPTKNVVSRKQNDDRHVSYAEALGRYGHERHDRIWWKQHYVIIVLVAGGYYYWDSGYWCPAWGYDAAHESYDYDGPIYTYGNLLPDQVIINVQHVLKELGYYAGDVTGSLGPASRQALSAYQRDYGLEVTGAIDEPTVQALGLI
jgi:Putative peptidoglycan binding domain